MTLLPLLRQTAWWIRVCDFPRLQIVGGLALALLLVLLLAAFATPAGKGFALALGAALLYQLSRIWPYTPLHRKQVQNAERPASDDANQVSLLVTNVLMYNRDASRCLGHIRHQRPDIVLAVETDEWWLGQLRSLEADFAYTCYAPLPNTYGMLVFSRLPLLNPQIQYLLSPEVPSFHGQVQLPNGVAVQLHFLHPKPPTPTEAKTSTRRDAELLAVGRLIAQHDGPHHRGRRPQRRGLEPHFGTVSPPLAAARPAHRPGPAAHLPRRLPAAALAPGPRVSLGAFPAASPGPARPHRLRPLPDFHPPQLRAQRLANPGSRTGTG